MLLDIVVATDANNGIGFAGQMPWRFSCDLVWFKNITSRPHLNAQEAANLFKKLYNNPKLAQDAPKTTPANTIPLLKETPVLLMGYTTWLSIGSKPLKNRMNVVVSKRHRKVAVAAAKEKGHEGGGSGKVKFFPSVEEAFAYMSTNYRYGYAVGGGTIYRYVIEELGFRALYQTKLQSSFKCDKFFTPPTGKITETKLGEFGNKNNSELRASVFRYQPSPQNTSPCISLTKATPTFPRLQSIS